MRAWSQQTTRQKTSIMSSYLIYGLVQNENVSPLVQKVGKKGKEPFLW